VSPERLIDLAILLIVLLVAIRFVPAAGRILRLYMGIRSRRLEDATGSAPPETPAVAALSERVGALGFSRIGVRSAVLPGPVRRFEWNLVDGPATTYVSLVPAPAMAGGLLMACYSAFADGAFVATTFPTGATVRRSDFDAAPAGPTPEDAVHAHYRRVSNFSTAHGPALANRSMADLLVRDDTYRRRHGGATIRTRVYVFIGMTALIVVLAALELIRLVVVDR
jgi:hypothetical protein